MIDIKTIEKAYNLAKERHDCQFRFGTNEPYLVHLLGVALALKENLTKENLTTDLIATALLHDILEDTPTTKLELSEMFGKKVANDVDLLTKKKTEGFTIEKYLLEIKKSPNATLVKLADRINNISTPSTFKDKAWNKKYLSESKLILKILGPCSKPLSKTLENKIKNYEDFIDKNFEK